MFHLDIVKDAFVTVLTLFLALSNGAADLLTHYWSDDDRYDISHIEAPTSSVSPLLGINTLITEQLRRDSRYQQAATIEGIDATSSTPTVSIEDALVNIFCTAHTGKKVRATTGSGVFIDSNGVILTNAHVAQFLLLAGTVEDTDTTCTIRQGNPAVSKYEASLLYISPTWIEQNAHQLYADKPSGTGERDFALLYVTKSLTDDMPQSFPALPPLVLDEAFDPTTVRVAGYPAEMLTERDAHGALIPAIATTSITRLFTFSSGSIDLVGIAPSDVGQQGSSGGPIVSDEGAVVGLIVTRGNPELEGIKSLRALTLPYIDRTLKTETGLDLTHTLSGDIPLRAQTFKDTIAPHLREFLVQHLSE